MGEVRPVRAQTAIRILQSHVEVQFAEVISFRLMAEADSTIVSVRLYYQGAGDGIRFRADAAFVPGTAIEASYTWRLQPGDLPPGERIEYTWRLRTVDGRTLDTKPASLIHADERFEWSD